MLTMLLLIATTLIGQAQAQTGGTWSAQSATCSGIVGEGGGKVFEATDGTMTWTSDSVDEWLGHTAPEFNSANLATLAVTANPLAKTALVSYVDCMKTSGATIPTVLMWANTAGGLNLWEADFAAASGQAYTWGGFADVGGVEFVELVPVAPGTGCGVYLPQSVHTPIAPWLPNYYFKWILPTTAPGDSDAYECEQYTCGGSCELIKTATLFGDETKCHCQGDSNLFATCETIDLEGIDIGDGIDMNVDGIMDGGLMFEDD